LAITARHVDGPFPYRGACAGNLDNGPDLRAAIGPLRNNAAEIYAIIWALLLIVTLPEADDTVTHFDSTVVANAAQTGPASGRNALLAKIANGTHLLCTARRLPRYGHTLGHVGHPWNESRGCLASAALGHSSLASRRSMCDLFCLKAEDDIPSAGLVPWLFAMEAPPSRAQAYHPMANDTLQVSFALRASQLSSRRSPSRSKAARGARSKPRCRSSFALPVL
jgi:hypothetical protein